MKKTMKLLAIIFCIIGLLGYGFKLMHWPGAGIILILSSLVMFVLLIMWFFMGKRSLQNLLLFLFGIFFYTAFLFKAMHWPGAGILFGIFPVVATILITNTIAKE
jgi:hypothetical protein